MLGCGSSEVERAALVQECAKNYENEREQGSASGPIQRSLPAGDNRDNVTAASCSGNEETKAQTSSPFVVTDTESVTVQGTNG